MNKLLLASLVVAFATTQVSAQTTTQTSDASKTGAKMKDVKPADSAPASGEPDTDEVITNRKLRAETGSKKKVSFSAALTYNGGSVEKPSDNDRPNITGARGTQLKAALSGTVGAKYKLNNLQSLSLDVGVGASEPFHSSDESFGERSYLDNPSLTYQLLGKISGVQSVTKLTGTAYTRDDLVKLGFQSNLGLQQIFVYDFGGSKFSVGALLAVDGSTYFKDNKELLAAQGDYGMGAYPFAEYVINDRFNIRTISGVWVYEHSRAQSSALTFDKNKIYQSVGLGISVTRDIYLYPNVQFLPEDIRADVTNVGLNANINL